MQIKTDNKTRKLVNWFDLPNLDRMRDFMHVTGEGQYDDRFFKYLNNWYDAWDFRTTRDSVESDWKQWDEYLEMSDNDAYLIKYADNYDSVVVGHAVW